MAKNLDLYRAHKMSKSLVALRAATLQILVARKFIQLAQIITKKRYLQAICRIKIIIKAIFDPFKELHK